MAEQMGIITLRGNIDKINFYKNKQGYQARKKGGIDKERLQNDPKFKRTREHQAEFGRSVKGATLITKALLKATIGSVDANGRNRLTKEIVAITRKDSAHPRGERTFQHAELNRLNGFEFNSVAAVSTVVKENIQSNINVVTGECTVQIPSLVSEEQVLFSREATHFRFRIVAASIDFEAGTFKMATEVSDYQPVDSIAELDPINLSLTLAPSTHPVFLALTIEYVQEVVGGDMYPLKNGSLNACRIEKVHIS